MHKTHLKKINQIMKYRLYKSGKLWVVATMATMIFGVSQLQTQTVKADVANDQNYSTQSMTSATTGSQSSANTNPNSNLQSTTSSVTAESTSSSDASVKTVESSGLLSSSTTDSSSSSTAVISSATTSVSDSKLGSQSSSDAAHQMSLTGSSASTSSISNVDQIAPSSTSSSAVSSSTSTELMDAELDLRMGSDASLTTTNWGTATLTIDSSGNALLANGEFKSTNRPSDAILESIRHLTFSNATYNDSYAAGLFAASNSMSLYDNASSINPFSSLQSIDFTGTSGWDQVHNFANMFAQDANLTSITFDHNFTTQNAVDTSGMFDHTSSLTQLDLSQGNFDTHNVVHMQNMFNDNYNLQTLNLGDQFDTSHVTEMYNLFQNDYVLNPLNLGSHFDTSQVTNMASMFNNLHALVNLDLGDQFDTSHVQNMDSMFNGMTNLTTLKLGDHFNTKNVTDMNAMFGSGNSLTSLDLGTQFDTSNVTSMTAMFGGLSSIKSLDLSHTNFDTSKVTNMSAMFYGLGSVQNLNLGSRFNTSNVTNFSGMFGQNYNLRRLNLGSQFDTTNATTVAHMFDETGLAYINLGDHFKLNSNVDQSGFYGPFSWMAGHTIFNFGQSDTTFNSNANMGGNTYQGNYHGKNYTVNGSNMNGLVFPGQTNGSLVPMMDWKSSAASYRDQTNQIADNIAQLSQAFNVAGLTSAMSAQYRSEINSAKAVADTNASLNHNSYFSVAANQATMDQVLQAASVTASEFQQVNLHLIVAIDANDNSAADTQQSLLTSYGNTLASQIATANSNAQGISELGSQTTSLLNTMNRNTDLTLTAYNDIVNLRSQASQAVADSQAIANLNALAQLNNLVPSYANQIQSSAGLVNSYNNNVLHNYNQASNTVDSIQDLASSMSQNSDLASLSSLMGSQFDSLFMASQDAGEVMSIADTATNSIGSYQSDAQMQSSLLHGLITAAQTAVSNHDSIAYASLANAASIANANLNNDNYQASYLNDSMSVALNGISSDLSNNPQAGLIADDQQTSSVMSVTNSAATVADGIYQSAQYLNTIANSMASSANNVLQSSNATIDSINQRHSGEQQASQAIDVLMHQNTDTVNSADQVVNNHPDFASLVNVLKSLQAKYQSLQALQTTINNTASDVTQQTSSANDNHSNATTALNGVVSNAQSMGSRALVGNLSSASTLLNQAVASQTAYNNFSNAVDGNVTNVNQNGNQFDQASAAMQKLTADLNADRSNFDSTYNGLSASASSVAQSKADSEAASAAKSKADSEAASAAKSKADSEAASAAKSKADSEAASAAKSKADSEAASAAKSKADSEAASAAKSKADSEVASAAKSKANSEAASAAKSKADSEAASAAKSKADSEAASAAKSKADSEAANAAKSKADSEAASAAKSKADSEAANAAKSKADSEAASAAKSKADSEAANAAKSKADSPAASSGDNSDGGFSDRDQASNSVGIQLHPTVLHPIKDSGSNSVPTYGPTHIQNQPMDSASSAQMAIDSSAAVAKPHFNATPVVKTPRSVRQVNVNVDHSRARTKLPQTGERDHVIDSTVIGSLLVAISGWLAFGLRKRHRDDQNK